LQISILIIKENRIAVSEFSEFSNALVFAAKNSIFHSSPLQTWSRGLGPDLSSFPWWQDSGTNSPAPAVDESPDFKSKEFVSNLSCGSNGLLTPSEQALMIIINEKISATKKNLLACIAHLLVWVK